MEPTTLYTICVLGAAAMFLVMRPGRRAVKLIGAVLGLGAIAWFLAASVNIVAPETREKPELLYRIFTLIAIASAVRMITHSRPVYCALYFVMVVLSSAALFLLLAAEFMAFALIIVYAGAILVTYMFVLMLAQQSPDPDHPDAAAYDRIPREPAAACVVGFLLLAVLGNVITLAPQEMTDPPSAREAALAQIAELNDMPRQLEAVVEDRAPGAAVQWGEDGRAVSILNNETAVVSVIMPDDTVPTQLELSPEEAPGNVQLVGLALVAKFPVSLELAGIILLLAMFGAVVLARRQIELGEDELRVAAGYRRLAEEGDADPDAAKGGGR